MRNEGNKRIIRIPETDAIVVGSGPNGLAAAITLARDGFSVVVIEAAETIGGGSRSAELTLPGFVHDVCSAIHPLGLGSPFFKTLPLSDHGLRWIQPPVSLAHPFDDGEAAIMVRSIETTAGTLGRDAHAYRKLVTPFVDDWPELAQNILGPALRFPRHPFAMTQFAMSGLRSAESLARSCFRAKYAQGLFAGLSAHSFLPLSRSPSAAFGLVLGILAHVGGWPIPQGGSQRIVDSLASYLRSLGGQTITRMTVASIEELTVAPIMLFDVTPKQLLSIARPRLPWLYRQQLRRYRYGPGVFKIDWALDGPIPWRAKECSSAGTVHVGGTMEEISGAEREVWRGRHPDGPFVLLAQQSLFDKTRTPLGKHTGWAYCHVPNGSTVDMTERIENQVERFAPGFRDLILARYTRRASEFERYNSNCIGGDINGGLQDIRQLFGRPTLRLNPYSTPIKGLYLCSSSTPPGGGVHGMCGYHAAQTAISEAKRGKS